MSRWVEPGSGGRGRWLLGAGMRTASPPMVGAVGHAVSARATRTALTDASGCEVRWPQGHKKADDKVYLGGLVALLALDVPLYPEP